MGRQIGFFFLVVGLIIVFMFAASFQVGRPEYFLCLMGLASLMLGAFLAYRYRRTQTSANRFRMINKMRRKEKKDD